MCKANLNIWLLVWVLVVILAGQAADGATITVANDGGPADFTSIQAAIDDANDYDQIEVAPGTYYEAIDFNGLAVRLYSSGGSEVTTIDGTGHYHVVQCVSGEDANTILEGFTITGGNANGPPGEDSVGGGMFNDQSSATVTNCFFTGNAGFEGAGMYNFNYSSPAMTGCTFSGNSGTSGGGMYNFLYSSPTVTGCLFSANTATVNGGGIYNRDHSHTTVNNCTFRSNTADKGGGMYNLEYSSPTVTNCLFNSNIAVQYGGGMFNYHCNPTLTNCTFSGNSGTSGGGMYNDDYSNPTLINCILWEDTPNEIFNVSPSAPLVTYCDIQGGYVGITNINSDPYFVDTDNPDPNLWDFRLLPVSPCIDAGSNSAPNLALTDLAGNPRVADGDNDGLDVVDMGVFELQPGIHNTTQNKWYVTIQIAIDDASDGDEIEVSLGTYYEAINFKGKAVRLYSSGGQDVTTIDGTGHYHVVKCVSGEDANTVLEGFTITGGNANGSPPYDVLGGGMYNSRSSPTVTNCSFSQNTASGRGSGMCNLQSSPTVTGCAFSGNTSEDGDGGGMYNSGGSPSVTNCTFSGNTATIGGGMSNYSFSSPAVTNCTFSNNTSRGGGGMVNYSSSSPTVTNCTFSDNSATSDYGGVGGGMYNSGSSPTVTNCIFTGNTADSGGGMDNSNSNPTLTNCTFSGNSGTFGGGGMRNVSESNPTVTNCTFSGNTSEYGGAGGMYNFYSSSPTVTNCTFSDNSATSDGGGMANLENSSPTVTNCILWGDSPNEIFDDANSSTTATYSDVGGGYAGTGNIDADPNFVDAASGNLRLSYGSPCIDAADSTALLPMTYSAIDLDGNIRFVDVSSITNTGSGPLEFLDMGAYEYPCNWSEGDINCDGVVDFKDFAIMAENWLIGAEPEL
jgi:parallel beta-helix repeat protein